MADDDDEETLDLEKLYKLVSDEEAAQLRDEMGHRLARARLNVGAAVPQEQLGELASEVVRKIAVEILEGTIKVKTAGQARDVAVAFHSIARLEQGKSTSNNVGDLPRAEREQIVADLAQAAAERVAEQEKGLRLVESDHQQSG